MTKPSNNVLQLDCRTQIQRETNRGAFAIASDSSNVQEIKWRSSFPASLSL